MEHIFDFSISFRRLVTCTAKSIKKLLIAIDIILRVLGICVDSGTVYVLAHNRGFNQFGLCAQLGVL